MKITEKFGNTFYTFDYDNNEENFFSGFGFIFIVLICIAIFCCVGWLLDSL